MQKLSVLFFWVAVAFGCFSMNKQNRRGISMLFVYTPGVDIQFSFSATVQDESTVVSLHSYRLESGIHAVWNASWRLSSWEAVNHCVSRRRCLVQWGIPNVFKGSLRPHWLTCVAENKKAFHSLCWHLLALKGWKQSVSEWLKGFLFVWDLCSVSYECMCCRIWWLESHYQHGHGHSGKSHGSTRLGSRDPGPHVAENHNTQCFHRWVQDGCCLLVCFFEEGSVCGPAYSSPSKFTPWYCSILWCGCLDCAEKRHAGL